MIESCPDCHEKVFFTGSICPNCGYDRDHPAVGMPPPALVAVAAAGEPASRPLAFWWAMALIVLAICSFVVDWTMVAKGGAIDYRNRVTGMRVLASGADPYHYKWSKGMPEQFCDPFDNPNMPMSKTTVSPAMLVAGWPWAVLPYPVSKAAWLLAEWGMLAGIWLIWFRWSGQTSPGRWWWTALVVGFTYTLAWRHHTEHGQGYLLWAFLLTVWMRLSLVNRTAMSGWLAGLVAGVLVCLRPPLLLGLGPFLVLRRRNQWLGAAVGLLLGLGIPALLKPAVWQDYGKAMATWSTVYRSQTEPRPGQRAFPPQIDGVPTNDFLHLEVIQIVDSSWYRACRMWGWREISDKAMLATLCLGFGAWLWVSRRTGDAAFMLGLAAWSFLADAFLPAYRYPYDDVMIINTIALIPAACRLRWTSYGLALLAILVGIWIVNSDRQPLGWWTYQLERWWIYLPTLALAALALLALYQSASARAADSKALST